MSEVHGFGAGGCQLVDRRSVIGTRARSKFPASDERGRGNWAWKDREEKYMACSQALLTRQELCGFRAGTSSSGR